MAYAIPEIITENSINETYRLILYIIIMILILLVLNNFKSSSCINTNNLELSNLTNVDNKSTLLNLKEHLTNNQSTDISGKYIQISNTNKKYIPINKIIIINNKRKLIVLTDFEKKETNTGVIFIYRIPTIENITKIILDTAKFNRYLDNIKTSNISVLDSDKNIIWAYNNIINVQKDRRYIDINIIDPIIKYDRPNNILCKNTSENCDQEKQLNISLIENTWNLK